MKKIKEFLTNCMTVNACKERIQEVISLYHEDESIDKPDLEILIESMTTIIACNKKNNIETTEDEACLEELKNELKKRIF